MSTALKSHTSPSADISIASAKKMRFTVVVSKWNESITNALLKATYNTLLKQGVKEKNISVVYVPGSFELTLGAQLALEQDKKTDGVICLGCVIQGETKHFDFICNAVSNGITQLTIQYKTPVIFGILTTNNLQQAKDRSGGKYGNKGEEAAITALEMAQLKRFLQV